MLQVCTPIRGIARRHRIPRNAIRFRHSKFALLDAPSSTSIAKTARPAARLSKFRGILQSLPREGGVDGYAGFETLTAGEIVLAACWAHTRRKFYEVHQATGSPTAAEALRRIAGLYAIETGIRGRSAAERRQHRKRYNRSGLGEAIRYALARRPALYRFIETGRIELDNNPSSVHPTRGARPQEPPFAGLDGGVDRWAVIASLLQTTKQRGRAIGLSQGRARSDDKRPFHEPDRRPSPLELDALNRHRIKAMCGQGRLQ
jgi:hypothetical protein